MVNFSLALCAAVASARGPIVTDRPDFTESSWAVPVGAVQVESGVTAEWEGGSRGLRAPELLARIGLRRGMEVRVGLPNYNSNSEDAEGFDDLYFGFKFELPNFGNFDVSLIPAVFIPVGAAGSDAAAPELKFTWATDLADGKALSGMLYVSSVSEGGMRKEKWQHTISLGVPIAPRSAFFIEHAADFGSSSPTTHLLHTGVVYQPDPNSQWDFHFGFGLSKSAPDFFVAGGYSVRLWR